MSKELKVIEGRTKLIVPHLEKEIIFLTPVYSDNFHLDSSLPERIKTDGTYLGIQRKINLEGLRVPTMAETASLIFAAFNSKDKYSKEIKSLIKREPLWAFTRIRYEPEKGVFVYDEKDNAIFENLKVNELEQKLGVNQRKGVFYNEDETLRFVPFGFRKEYMTPRNLEKNPYVIAIAGEEGAEKLAECAERSDNQSTLRIFENINMSLIGVSKLHRYFSAEGIFIKGDIMVEDKNQRGCAFGILEKDTLGFTPTKEN